jgi:hypothetical protein
MCFFVCILRIPAVSFASKICPWATSDTPIESQTPTECAEIAFAQNELVAPEKKPNQKLDAGGKPSTWFPPGELVEQQTKLNILTSPVFAQRRFFQTIIF